MHERVYCFSGALYLRQHLVRVLARPATTDQLPNRRGIGAIEDRIETGLEVRSLRAHGHLTIDRKDRGDDCPVGIGIGTFDRDRKN